MDADTRNGSRGSGRAWAFLFGVFLGCLCLEGTARALGPCGEAVSFIANDGARFRVSHAMPSSGRVAVSLILLPGGSGFANLDDSGCARALTGNSLIRSVPHFTGAGAATAVMDAPVGYQGADGLGGFRLDPRHASQIGELVVWLRAKHGVPVWVVGTSRGAISAANAAGLLSGPSAPDGVVLTSPVTVGSPPPRFGGNSWVSDTVFLAPLDHIRMPLLVVGHGADKCFRSPPANLERVAAETQSTRRQVVIVEGGPGSRFSFGATEACTGSEPHGFAGQDAEVAAGMMRFIQGGAY
jgi:hypothetical protein